MSHWFCSAFPSLDHRQHTAEIWAFLSCWELFLRISFSRRFSCSSPEGPPKYSNPGSPSYLTTKPQVHIGKQKKRHMNSYHWLELADLTLFLANLFLEC